jgi:hypothetical protein
MKNLQVELKTIQGENKQRQAQLEPLQEKAREDDNRVGNRERNTRTCTLRKYRSVEGAHHNAGGGDPDRKSAQVKTQVDALTKKFQALEKLVQEAHTA